MRAVVILFALLIAFLVVKAVEVAGRVEDLAGTPESVAQEEQIDSAVQRLNEQFQKQWQAENVPVVDTVDNLSVFRRL